MREKGGGRERVEREKKEGKDKKDKLHGEVSHQGHLVHKLP